MFAVLIGRFHYTGSLTEVRVRDFSVGTFHYSTARDAGDGEEVYVFAQFIDEGDAKDAAEALEASREKWESTFIGHSAFSPVPPEEIRRLRDTILPC